MNDLLHALHRIEALLPPPLPPTLAPASPDLTALPVLGEYMGAPGAATELTTLAHRLDDDRAHADQLQHTAAALIDAARADLLHLALELLRTAVPLAVQALIPQHRPAADAQLAAVTHAGVAQAETRAEALTAELEPVAVQLDAIEDDEATAETSATAAADPAASAAGQTAVDAAMSQLGTPYVWGGTQPGGFDCSGLVQWAYRQAGVELPRTAEEMTVGAQVTADQLQPGDLAVWDGHVAMYIGDGHMIEAGDPVQTNPVRTSNMSMGFQGFWRPTAEG